MSSWREYVAASAGPSKDARSQLRDRRHLRREDAARFPPSRTDRAAPRLVRQVTEAG